jgi:hypothetical protein
MSTVPASTPAPLALRFFSFLNQGDLESALFLLDSSAPIDIVPAGVQGTAAAEGRAFFKSLVAAFPDVFIHIHSVMATPDLAVVEVKMEGTQAADFRGVINQEKHLDIDQAWMFWTAGQRITGLRAYWCQSQFYRRLAVKRLDRISILG